MTTNLNSVVAMLRRAKAFEALPKPQQAALRAQVSRMRKSDVTDPLILEVLEQIQKVIGESEPRERAVMTLDDLQAEFADYADYDPRRRAAFKARVTRLRKAAEAADDLSTVSALDGLLEEATTVDTATVRSQIEELLKDLNG